MRLATEGVDSEGLRAMRALLRAHQERLLQDSGLEVPCRAGCASCCTQVVFDVRAFEIEALGRRLLEQGSVASIVEALEASVAAFERTRSDTPRRAGESDDEWNDRCAREHHRRGHPCVFLDDEGACSIHEDRPWSCRRFFALGDPRWCGGAWVDDPRRQTFSIEPFEDFDAWLDRLDATAFAVDTDRLDLGLWRWLRAHRPDPMAGVPTVPGVRKRSERTHGRPDTDGSRR